MVAPKSRFPLVRLAVHLRSYDDLGIEAARRVTPEQ